MLTVNEPLIKLRKIYISYFIRYKFRIKNFCIKNKLFFLLTRIKILELCWKLNF